MVAKLSAQIAAYERILTSKVWTASPLLSVYGQRMRDMLEKMRQAQRLPGAVLAQDGFVFVYVGLYHQEGGIVVWQKMLRRLNSAIQSRPVFMHEEEAVANVRNHRCESYVVLHVPKRSVMLSSSGYYLNPAYMQGVTIDRFHWCGRTFEFDGCLLSGDKD